MAGGIFNDEVASEYKVKVNKGDGESGYLLEKIQAGNNIALTLDDTPTGKAVVISSAVNADTVISKISEGDGISIDTVTNGIEISSLGKVKTKANDEESGYLLDKIGSENNDAITVSQGSGDSEGQVVLDVPNIGLVKHGNNYKILAEGQGINLTEDGDNLNIDVDLVAGQGIEIDDNDDQVQITNTAVGLVKINSGDTAGYLNDKIEGIFPTIKTVVSGNKIRLRSAEKLALSEFNTNWVGDSYTKSFVNDQLRLYCDIMTSDNGLYGVNFCIKQSNPAHLRIFYTNSNPTTITANLYYTDDSSDWTDSGSETVSFEPTTNNNVVYSEVEIVGGNYPLYFLLIKDDEDVSGIRIFDIYRY